MTRPDAKKDPKRHGADAGHSVSQDDQAVAEPLGKIDKVVMIDQGGGNGNGDGGGLNRFAQTTPTLIFSLLQQLQSLGLTLPEVLAQLGINQEATPAKDGAKDVTPAKEK